MLSFNRNLINFYYKTKNEDRDSNSRISICVFEIMITCDLLILEKELLTMVRAVSEDQIYDTIEFNEFLQMMSKQQKDGMNEDSLKDAFR